MEIASVTVLRTGNDGAPDTASVLSMIGDDIAAQEGVEGFTPQKQRATR